MNGSQLKAPNISPRRVVKGRGIRIYHDAVMPKMASIPEGGEAREGKTQAYSSWGGGGVICSGPWTASRELPILLRQKTATDWSFI